MEKLIILDLDETLVHATKNKLPIKEDFKLEDYFIYKRPFLNDFLKSISEDFKIGIWSSASDFYVSEIVDTIKSKSLEFEFIWGRSKCSRRRDFYFDEYVYEKRLDKLKKKGFPLEHILIIDDSPEKSRTNFGNAIHIKPFEGDLNDSELNFLQKYLLEIKNVENVRELEKRHWRLETKI